VGLSGRITHDNVVLPAYTCNPPWLQETLDVSSGKLRYWYYTGNVGFRYGL